MQVTGNLADLGFGVIEWRGDERPVVGRRDMADFQPACNFLIITRRAAPGWYG